VLGAPYIAVHCIALWSDPCRIKVNGARPGARALASGRQVSGALTFGLAKTSTGWCLRFLQFSFAGRVAAQQLRQVLRER